MLEGNGFLCVGIALLQMRYAPVGFPILSRVVPPANNKGALPLRSPHKGHKLETRSN